MRIAVGGDGNAWVVNKFGHIYRYNGRGWVATNGRALDIAAHWGNVGVIGTDRRIYRRWHGGNTWRVTNGYNAFSIAHGSRSRMACTNMRKSIWYGH